MTALVFIIFFLLLVLAAPIAICMGFATIFPHMMNPAFAGNLEFIARSMIKSIDSMSFLAIPLFMLSGAIMATGGLSRRLFDVFAVFIGKLPAGMPCAVVVTCLFYGAISGSGPATCAAVGAMCIPVLTNLGYEKIFAGALVATAAGLGVIIPPSIPYISYGVITDTSVGDLFTAGILPGILIAVWIMAYAVLYCRKNGEDHEKINANVKRLRERGYFRVILDGFWALLTPVIILGGIYSGIVTPTEAACVSVFYSILVCLFIYKTIKFRDIWGFVKSAVKSYAPLGLNLCLARTFVQILSLLKAPQSLAAFLQSAINNRYVFLLVLIVILFFLGMVIDVGPANTILAPMLLPFAISLGISQVHLGIILTTVLAIGMVTPPFGVNLFVAAPMIEENPMTVGRKALPIVGFYFIAILMIAFIPQISLILLGK